jgi:hypothetical protein
LKKLFLILALFIIIFPLAAQNNEGPDSDGDGRQEIETIPEQEQIIPVYDLGDQFLGMNGGTNFPLFFDFYNQSGDDRFFSAGQFYQVPLGGSLSIEWNSYINNNMTLGIEIGSFFASTFNNTHVMIPVTASFQYIFHFFPFYLPLSIEAGFCFNIISDSRYFGPIIKPGMSFYYRFSTTWDFGLNLKYWWVPEVYFGDDPPKEQSAFGNFLELSFSALYHF